MSQGQKAHREALGVFRLETEAEVSVSELGIPVQSVRAENDAKVFSLAAALCFQQVPI